MASLSYLLTKLRSRRLDDDTEPQLWSDEELTEHYNDAVRQVCLRQRALIESENPDLCQYDIVPGQLTIDLDPHVLAVRFAYAVYPDGFVCDDKERPKGITTKSLMRHYPNWIQNTEQQDRLRFWIPDYQERKLALWPYPITEYTLHLSVWRLPLDEELLDVNDLEGEPVINQAWHDDLPDWAEHLAYLKKDADTFDKTASDRAGSIFEAKVGRLPTATEIRLWGVSPPSGSPLMFY